MLLDLNLFSSIARGVVMWLFKDKSGERGGDINRWAASDTGLGTPIPPNCTGKASNSLIWLFTACWSVSVVSNLCLITSSRRTSRLPISGVTLERYDHLFLRPCAYVCMLHKQREKLRGSNWCQTFHFYNPFRYQLVSIIFANLWVPFGPPRYLFTHLGISLWLTQAAFTRQRFHAKTERFVFVLPVHLHEYDENAYAKRRLLNPET